MIQTITLEPNETAFLVSLQSVLGATGLILVCPRCLAEGGSHLRGDVAVTEPRWHLTCRCRDRVMERNDARSRFVLAADGELLASADRVLSPLGLSVRCGEPRCVRHPIAVTRGPEGVEVRCQCAKSTIRVQPQTAH